MVTAAFGMAGADTEAAGRVMELVRILHSDLPDAASRVSVLQGCAFVHSREVRAQVLEWAVGSGEVRTQDIWRLTCAIPSTSEEARAFMFDWHTAGNFARVKALTGGTMASDVKCMLAGCKDVAFAETWAEWVRAQDLPAVGQSLGSALCVVERNARLTLPFVSDRLGSFEFGAMSAPRLLSLDPMDALDAVVAGDAKVALSDWSKDARRTAVSLHGARDVDVLVHAARHAKVRAYHLPRCPPGLPFRTAFYAPGHGRDALAMLATLWGTPSQRAMDACEFEWRMGVLRGLPAKVVEAFVVDDLVGDGEEVGEADFDTYAVRLEQVGCDRRALGARLWSRIPR